VSKTPQDDLTRVRAAAEALRREIVDDPLALRARLEEPIPVRSATGELDSWFVALTTGDLLLGFFQLERDLGLHRYSTFQRTPGSASECPPAATWLDPDTIRERARAALAESDQLEQPILSYHGNRDRLAWRVPVANRRASIYVIGDEVYMDAA
jgi:hypothetical protein